MFRRDRKSLAVRSGFTLLELVVVMAILAALAGILVPLLPGLVGKASMSSAATNLTEINKAVQLYASQNNDQYPDQLDSIVDDTGAIAGYVPNGGATLSGGTGTVPALLVKDTLNANDVAALNAVGVKNEAQMISASTMSSYLGAYQSATFYADGFSLNSVTLTQSTPVATVTVAAAAQKFGVAPTGTNGGRYIVFGLGQYATCVGSTMNKAPVWVNSAAGQDPNSVYSRFGLVFQTVDVSGNPLSRALLVGVVQFSTSGLLMQDDDLSQYSAQ